jgi:hypothetical protein
VIMQPLIGHRQRVGCAMVEFNRVESLHFCMGSL